jgi:hypothetical protein
LPQISNKPSFLLSEQLAQLACETHTIYLVLVGLAVGGRSLASMEMDWWLTLMARFPTDLIPRDLRIQNTHGIDLSNHLK